MAIPEQITESEFDDIQSVDFDLDVVAKRFIDPIEQKRSHCMPNILVPSVIRQSQSDVNANIIANPFDQAVQADLQNSNLDISEAQESRAHTFYRMLGLPVMDQSFDFYNPGFNPLRNENIKNTNQRIATNLDSLVVRMQTLREANNRQRNSLFKRSVLDSVVFALAQRFPAPFQKIDKNKNWNELDLQSFSIPRRKQYIDKNYQINGGSIQRFFDSNTHVLRPFLVNPSIERVVQTVGRSSKICEPFLPNKTDTKIENGVFLDRPGIEFILRLRLKQQSEQDFISTTIFALDANEETDGVSLADLRRISLALLADDKITEESILQSIGLSNYEIININKLIRLINASIDKLTQAIETIDYVSKKINWIPLPGQNGLEFSNDLVITNIIQRRNRSSELERRITQLRLKEIESKRRGIPTDNDIGTFSIDFFENTDKLFTEELSLAEAERNELIRQGANALRTIEIITGEQSGLGLIDILAIYTALWAIDLDVLVSLLDRPSFQRLVDNNKDLINSNVNNRIANGYNPVIGGFDAIQRLESQIINILDFADRRFTQKAAASDILDGGAISVGG